MKRRSLLQVVMALPFVARGSAALSHPDYPWFDPKEAYSGLVEFSAMDWYGVENISDVSLALYREFGSPNHLMPHIMEQMAAVVPPGTPFEIIELPPRIPDKANPLWGRGYLGWTSKAVKR